MGTPIEINRLQAARMAGLNGQHEEALREFIWFHEHALKERPALIGVRLSYALAYWVELGKVYPPAMRALEQIRDDKSAALLEGTGDTVLFRDVIAINEYLGTTAATYGVYRTLFDKAPELAMQCVRVALPAVLQAGDFILAKRMVPDPNGPVKGLTRQLNQDVGELKAKPLSSAPARWAHVHNYVESVQGLLSVLIGNGEPAKAASVKKSALKAIQNPSLRRQVVEAFIKPANFPLSRGEKRAGPMTIRRSTRTARLTQESNQG